MLHGKPLNEKPRLGKPPVYLDSADVAPSSAATAKLAALRHAVLNGRPGVQLYRRAFLDECLVFAESLRVRTRPTVEDIGKKVLEDVGKLKQVRQLTVDWLLLEGDTTLDESLAEAVFDYLERLRGLKGRPPEINQWNDAWFEAHALFVYETFLYVVAALLKVRRYSLLAEIFVNHYLLPESEGRGANRFEGFDTFWADSNTLQSVLAPEGRRLLSPAAALVQHQADRADISFRNLLEADALAFLVAVVSPTMRWYPQMLLYLQYGDSLPFFVRCAQKRQFKALAELTGQPSGDSLRTAYRIGVERLDVARWQHFRMTPGFAECLNLEKLDTL